MAMYIFTFIMGILYVKGGMDKLFMGEYYGNGSGFSSAVTIISLFYLLNTDFKLKNKYFYFIMLSLGFLVLKSRFYGFYAISIMLLFFGKNIKLRFSLKNIVFFSLLLVLAIIVSWSKIQVYFMPDEVEGTARSMLYVKSVNIFKDYFPFGSGYATYGTHASRLVYSNIYDKYNMSYMWGLSRENDSFIADTFFPSLAQFGILGLFLFIYFFRYVIKSFNKFKPLNKTNYSININTIFILSLSYLFIECVANALLTNSFGVTVMSIIALLISNRRQEKEIQKLTYRTRIAKLSNEINLYKHG